MPNRYVREAAIKSKAVNSLSWQGEVFWRRMLNLVDDFGRYSADPEELRADVFPRQLEKVREADISRLLLECEQAGLLFRFSANAKWYLVINQWEQGRAKKSKYPVPPDNICKHLLTHTYDGLQMFPTPTPTPTLTPAPTTERESAEAMPVSENKAERPLAAGIPPEVPKEPPFAEAVVPTWDEVKAMAAMPTCGVPEDDARKFFDYYNANNLWQNRHGRPVNVLNSLIVWFNRSKTMNTSNPAKPVRPAGAPTLTQVNEYARTKFDDPVRATTFAADFYRFWNDPKRGWKAMGKAIDWQIKFSEPMAKQR